VAGVNTPKQSGIWHDYSCRRKAILGITLGRVEWDRRHDQNVVSRSTRWVITPLDWAIENQNLDVASVLRERGGTESNK